jgi:hypothetical protein
MSDRATDSAERTATARALRAEHAQAAAYYAHRAQQARAAAHDGEAARWAGRYRRSVTSCRLLGELIRGESAGASPASARDATVVALAPARHEKRIPTTGEAA